jgi:APA family basic amino acid/polyamine antiporter
MQESTNFAKIMVIIKIAVIAIFVIVGAFYVKPDNWTPFVPNGIKGIELGIFTIFYAYVGFDAISTAAEETKNPQKDLPIGLIGSLLACSIIYILVTIVLTGMLPVGQIDITAPIAHAMRFIGQDWFAGAISIGALAGLTSVLIVLIFGTSRILYAMARDGFFPKVMSEVHPKYKTPYVMTIVSTILMIIGSLFINMQVAAELCVLGTLVSFIIVCIGIVILRYTEPNAKRAFKVPFCPWFPLLGIICCGGLMIFSMCIAKGETAILSTLMFIVWVIMGVVIYLTYGYRKNREAEKLLQVTTEE